MQKQLQRKGIKFERYCNSRCTAYTPSLRAEWGRAVKERDGNKCVICGSADHIEPIISFPGMQVSNRDFY